MNLTKLILFLLVTCFFPSQNLSAQEAKLISVKKLKKDLKDLKLLIEAHPDPYTHIPEDQFNLKWSEVEKSIDRPLTIIEFYKKVSLLLALIKDGHTSAGLPTYYTKKRKKEEGVFPYELHLSNDDELYVLKKFNNGKIPIAARILEINDIKVDSFLRIIDPYISYEKKKFRNTIIDDDFDKYLLLAFGQTNGTKIKYFSKDTLITTTKNMDYKLWKKFNKSNREERENKIAKGKPYDYKKIKKGIGLINIYSFSTPNFDGYKIFLFDTFKEIRKDSIHTLIIDIRGNYGGWPKVASKLFHYISNDYFKTMAKSEMKVSLPYKNYFYDQYPSLRTNKPYFPQRRHFVDINAIIRNDVNTFVNEESFFNEKPDKKQYEFNGDCLLLMNRDSYSAASSFASTFQCYLMGKIIGEETGGTKIFRANAIYKELYRTQILIAISTTKMFTTCFDQEFEGVIPDIEYTPSIIELTSKLDTHLYYALNLIKLKQKLKKKALLEEQSKK